MFEKSMFEKRFSLNTQYFQINNHSIIQILCKLLTLMYGKQFESYFRKKMIA